MLLNYLISRFVLGLLCVRDLVRLSMSSVHVAGWSTTSACNNSTTQTQPHQISNTQRTENKTTDVVIQQHSRKLLMMMDILISKTCWVHKKWNSKWHQVGLLFLKNKHAALKIQIIKSSLCEDCGRLECEQNSVLSASYYEDWDSRFPHNVGGT